MTQQDQGNGHNPSRYQTKHRHTRAGYLTAGEAMRRIGLPRSTFYDYVKRGIIPRTAEGYPEKEIDRLAKEFGHQSSPLSSQSQQACPQASHSEGTLPPSPSNSFTERTAMNINPYNWSGRLTEENLEEIAQILRDRLTGRTYTRIEINETAAPPSQSVREQQAIVPSLVGGDAIKTERSGDTWFITIFDTLNTWYLSTRERSCLLLFTHTTLTAVYTTLTGERYRRILVIDPLTEKGQL